MGFTPFNPSYELRAPRKSESANSCGFLPIIPFNNHADYDSIVVTGDCWGGDDMRGYLALVAAVSPAGCASGSTGGEVLAGSSVRSSAARLVIYRSSAMGFAVQPNYVVDGKVIASSQPAGFVVCDLPPGPHEVAVANLPLSTNLFGHGSEKVTVDLRPGSTAYFSADPQMGIVTPGQITLIQGPLRRPTLHQTTSACGNA
jgi:hypothetical protein